MHHSAFRYLLTLVLLAFCVAFCPLEGHTAVPQPSPDTNEPSPPEDPPADPNTDILSKQSLDIANPPLPPRSRESAEYFHRYRKSLSVRLGPFRGLDEDNHGTLYGLVYNFPAFSLRSFEAGADLLSNGAGALHLAQRFEFSRTWFRPFLTAGFGVRIVPKEQLTSFLKGANYQLRVGAGFEFLVRKAQSVRVDTALLLMTDTQQLLGTLGYVWAW